MFFNVCLHLRSFLLCADWWKSDSSLDREPATGELELEFKFQRGSFKLSFLFLTSESLLAGLVGRGKHVLNGTYQEGELYRLCGGM